MEKENSIVAELLQKINLTKLRPIPNYLSSADAKTVSDFEQSKYGEEYILDISNIEWGKTSNDSHVFDIFSEFCIHRDSTKVRLDMLQHVAANNQRYKWDGHVFLTMHGIHLDIWHQKMSYWGTKADELAIYALSDMLQRHSFVVTKNRPWTTVDASVRGTDIEILHLCPVKLVFLGENRFGRLWRKLQRDPPVSTNQTNQPAFPDLMPPPIINIPAPPTLEELETAETLLTMQSITAETFDVQMELQEPTVSAIHVLQGGANDILIENPFNMQDFADCLSDAMDKIMEHEDVSFSEPTNWLKFRDCMDLVTGRIDDTVDYVNLENIAQLVSGNVQRTEIKPCRVELVRIKPTPTIRLPSLQTTSDLLSLNEYFTHSRSKPKPKRKNRHPRYASTNVNYAETGNQSEGEIRQKQLKLRTFSPPAVGPSQSRIASQDKPTIAPDVRLPPVETGNKEKHDTSPTELPSLTIKTLNPVQTKPKHGRRLRGTFSAKSFILKKIKRRRNYGCKLCDAVLSSAHLLTVHHREKHGILYCETCDKAFNNPTSLVRHKYQHRELRFQCNCGAAFAFASQLQTHSVVHRRHAAHHCVFPKCGRSFKNKGDLKRHSLEHTTKPHECPDCDYKNADRRNLESHRLIHLNIKNHVCAKCGESFKYNTQLRRHPPKCTGIRRSNSPDY